MKRSEFERLIASEATLDDTQSLFSQIAKIAAAGAEAAGVKWDPEEPSLPVKVRLNRFGQVTGEDLKPLVTDERLWEAWVIETIRRYNAWPELEKLANSDRIVAPSEIAAIIGSGK